MFHSYSCTQSYQFLSSFFRKHKAQSFPKEESFGGSFKTLLSTFKTTNLPFTIFSWPEYCDGCWLLSPKALFMPICKSSLAPRQQARFFSILLNLLKNSGMILRCSFQKIKFILLAYKILPPPTQIYWNPCLILPPHVSHILLCEWHLYKYMWHHGYTELVPDSFTWGNLPSTVSLQ